MNLLPLQLFNDRVERLEQTRLSGSLSKASHTLPYEKVMNRQWVAADDIVPDDVDSFVLHLRLLLQNGDGFSIDCLSRIYEQQTTPSELRIQFNRQRESLRIYLAAPSPISKLDKTRNYTNKELFDTIIYGGLAHGDEKFRLEYYILTSQGFFSAFVFGAFLQTLKRMFGVLKKIRDLNLGLIEHFS